MCRCGPKSINGGHDEERALLVGNMTMKATADNQVRRDSRGLSFNNDV